jgi:hypothetical protein
MPLPSHGIVFYLPLFQELGYGRLLTAKATNISGSDYPISHVWGQCPIHLMGWNVPIDKRVVGVAGASHTNPHSLVQQFFSRFSFSSVTSQGSKPINPTSVISNNGCKHPSEMVPARWNNSGSASKKQFRKSVRGFWKSQVTLRC